MAPQILLADDEAAILRLFSQILESAGYATLSALTSTEAAELFSQRADEIGALVLDVNLPPGGAEEVLEVVLALRPELPFLIVSGTPVEGHLATQLERHQGTFLLKPFRSKELLAWVEDHV